MRTSRAIEPGEPRRDALGADLLAQQDVALPRQQALRGDELGGGVGREAVVGHHRHRTGSAPGERRVGGTAGGDLVAAHPADHEEHHQRGECATAEEDEADPSVVDVAPHRQWRQITDLGRRIAADHGAADRDALARAQRGDDGAVHVAVALERAPAGRTERPDVARRVLQVHPGDARR